jgi:hypothetical protein
MGDVPYDSGDYERPTIDPSSLPGSDALSCLILPGMSRPVIEDLRFRNGAEMFPRPPSIPGGIWSHSEHPVFRRCQFDSVYMGVVWDHVELPPCTVEMERCEFRDDTALCVSLGRGRLLATDCFFSGSGFALVECTDSSQLNRCTLRNGISAQLLIHLLVGYGRGIEVRDCVFGPYGPFPYAMVEIRYSGARIEGNLFANSRCASALYTAGSCDDSIGFVPFMIRNNHFVNNGPAAVEGQCFGGIVAGCDSADVTVVAALIENNIFEDCSSYVRPKAIALGNGGVIARNVLTRLAPADFGAVYVYDSDSVTMGNNLIWETSYALRNWDANDEPLDARWNWWGDSTGPYHATENPNGQGDEVRGNVILDPWYPDTSFWDDVRRITAPLPERFSLEVFPNPFNSVVTLELIPSKIAVVRVELFDILGRRVQEIWSGPIASERTIRFNGSQLATGIYFVRVWESIGNRTLAMNKLVLLR